MAPGEPVEPFVVGEDCIENRPREKPGVDDLEPDGVDYIAPLVPFDDILEVSKIDELSVSLGAVVSTSSSIYVEIECTEAALNRRIRSLKIPFNPFEPTKVALVLKHTSTLRIKDILIPLVRNMLTSFVISSKIGNEYLRNIVGFAVERQLAPLAGQNQDSHFLVDIKIIEVDLVFLER